MTMMVLGTLLLYFNFWTSAEGPGCKFWDVIGPPGVARQALVLQFLLLLAASFLLGNGTNWGAMLAMCSLLAGAVGLGDYFLNGPDTRPFYRYGLGLLLSLAGAVIVVTVLLVIYSIVTIGIDTDALEEDGRFALD